MNQQLTRFSTLIRDARKAIEPLLTQEAVAEKLGVKQPAVSAWERGEAYPSASSLVALAEILNLDAGDLLRAIAAEQTVAPSDAA